MLFEYLKSITVSKDSDLQLEDYIPYLINRWLSFGAWELTPALNETVNMLGGLEKEKHFKLLLTMYPKQKRQPRFNYIKKKKQTTETDLAQNKLIAQNKELSTREIKEYNELVEFLTTTK